MFHHLQPASKRHWSEVIILGLCPLFVVVESAIQGIAVGVLVSATLFVISLVIGLIRKFIVFELHILVVLIVSSAVISALTLFVAVNFFGLYLIMGIYFPLIAINSFVFTQIEEIYFRENLAVSMKQGFFISVIIITVFSVFGLVRELLINATLFKQFDFDLGIFKPDSGITFVDKFSGISIFESSAGVLLILAMLIAFMNFIASFSKSQATIS